jgi:hypothetical protein
LQNTAGVTVAGVDASGNGVGGLAHPPMFKNLIINGDMQVAQRNTSVASITAGGYFTADRFKVDITTMGTWTQSVENDAPTGSGFRKSLKMLCTTADASPAADDQIAVRQFIEGQNLQHIAKGTSSAKELTLSFWVKSNVTGTYIAELFDQDNTRQVSKSYTISASATWEKKTLTFPADTTGALDNDNAASFFVGFWLGVGTNRSSGTLNTSWASNTNANRAVGQTNLASATNNYWQVTGVQLEVGSTATEFEFKPYDYQLKECYRYYQKMSGTEVNDVFAVGYVDPFPAAFYYFKYISNSRTDSPSIGFTAVSTFSDANQAGTATCTAITYYSSNSHTARLSTNHTGAPNVANQAVMLTAKTTAAAITVEDEL